MSILLKKLNGYVGSKSLLKKEKLPKLTAFPHYSAFKIESAYYNFFNPLVSLFSCASIRLMA